MSIYSCNISNVSRAAGSSSCATLSYISGEKVREDRTGELYQYGRSERVLAVETILPENAPAEYREPARLFNSIENYEKADNARTAKKIMVALPREFDQDTQRKVLQEYIRQNITAQGYACTYVIHTDKDNSNPHAHILIANRQINEKGEWSTKSRKEYVLDEKGERIPVIDPKTGEQKLGKRNERIWKRVSVQVNPLDKKETLEQLRESWAVECNKYLAPDLQIDHRSYAEQGREEEPTIHEGYASRKIEEQGGISERCEVNRQIQERNRLLQQLRAALENVRQQLSELIREKGAKVHERIGELLQRSRFARDSERTGTEHRGQRAEAKPDRAAGTGSVRAFLAELRADERASEQKRDDKIAERKDRDIERKRQSDEAKRRAETVERADQRRSRDYGMER